MILQFLGSKSFTATVSKWSKPADETLLKLVDKYGPSWTMLSFKIPNRSPVEVRRRYLLLSGSFDNQAEDVKMRLRAGWDRTSQGDWLRIPMDTIASNPHSQLVGDVPRYRRAYLKRARNWQDAEEQRAVLFGAIEYAGDWEKTVKGLKRRTAVQCKNFVEERLAFTVPSPDPRIEEVRQRLFSKYLSKNVITHNCQ